jgi:hypothetical protein
MFLRIVKKVHPQSVIDIGSGTGRITEAITPFITKIIQQSSEAGMTFPLIWDDLLLSLKHKNHGESVLQELERLRVARAIQSQSR